MSSSNRMPVLFVSHGSPEIAVRETAAHNFLRELGRELPRPSAILVASAHWETDAVTVATTQTPATIYDFGSRFDRRLWDIDYAAPVATGIATRAHDLLAAEFGDQVETNDEVGRDHGVWTPLHLIFPAADIPLAQVAIQPDKSPAHHIALGKALAPLRDEGVLILASGALTHNLSEFRGRDVNAPAEAWVTEFADWMAETLSSGNHEALQTYRAQAPYAERNHPEDEHLYPVFVAAGAAGPNAMVTRLHNSIQHGVLAMDAYRFD
ncbi:MAG: class III extradiol ring-cleavage dioxygenase [Pseudomonadota bacterium]